MDLRVLYVQNNSINDEGVISIQKLKNLRNLNLAQNKITRNSIILIINIQNLEILYIYDTLITQSERKQHLTNFDYYQQQLLLVKKLNTQSNKKLIQ